jgi:hypothetical protein
MSPKQKKLAAKAPPPNKLDEKDFKVLREEKAKGRGMGLQDEKVQPGKVMKARVGKSIKTGRISDMSFDEKMKRVESGQINKKTGRFTSMNAMRDAKGFQKGETASDFNKRRMKLERAAKVAKSTRLGKILLPVVGAAVAAKTYLNSKMNKKKDVKKKMGGGMIKAKKGHFSKSNVSGHNRVSSGGGKFLERRLTLGGVDAKKYMKTLGVFPKVSSGAGGKGGGRDTRTITEKGQFIKRRKKLMGAKSLIGKSGRIGAAITGLTIAGAGAAKLGQTIGKKIDEMKKKNKKMGGGMMQKPMGYKSGMGPAGAAGPSAGRPGGRRPMQQGPKGGIGSMPKKRDGIEIIVMTKDGPKRITRSELDGMSGIEQKMGGGMIGPSQRPGYSKGTMVKARGCKLGRTRPTKIT